MPDCSTPPIDDARTWTRKTSPELPPDPGPQEAGPCDPLQTRNIPIELEHPIAVGRHPDGTLYVVDRVGDDSRSFSGTAGVLQRGIDVRASESDRAHLWDDFTANGQSWLLRIDREAWHAERLGPRHFSMARLGEVDPHSSAPERMCQGELLEILSPEAVEGWEVRNREETITIEYLAEIEDGRLLLVTQANGLSTIRVFFGPKHEVGERDLSVFARARDGGTTNVEFFVDGELAQAVFPIRCQGRDPFASPPENELLQRNERCPGTLTVGDETHALPATRFRPTRADIPPAAFVCTASGSRE